MPANDRWSRGDVLDEWKRPDYVTLEVRHGMTLTHTGSRTEGTVVGFAQGDRVILRDRFGVRQSFPAHDGAFMHRGRRVALRAPDASGSRPAQMTRSGSVGSAESRAKVAKASRIWVEGVHDAELIEKVWGDDLRAAAIVVEPLHGIDELSARVETFAPNEHRRLGVLLDHLVDGTKEARTAAGLTHPSVLVCGHPYVDIWQAIKPEKLGFAQWPTVPRDVSWKEGVLDALGVDASPQAFWRRSLDAVDDYRDLETPLVNAVEQLIDFVTAH